MEYHIHKTDLQNRLLADTLQALAECYAKMGMELYVVGAAARDITMHLHNIQSVPRRTLDLDVAVALKNWEQYSQLSDMLLQRDFVKAPEKQRFYYEGIKPYKYEVDIVPFGMIAEQVVVAWPPDDSPIMSVRCFNDVMQYADTICVENIFSFKIASLSGQFLIKLDTWSDRHTSTKKDAADMVFFLQNTYVAYALARPEIPPEIDVDANRFDVMVAGAEWIACDLKQMLTTEHRLFYANLFHEEVSKGEESALLNDLLDMSSTKYYDLFRRALQRMAEILNTSPFFPATHPCAHILNPKL